MNQPICFLFVAMLATSVAIGAEPRGITKADSVIAIYTENWELGSSEEDQLIFCAWDDGRVVWSHDRLKGGPPYQTAQVKPETFAATLERLKTIGVFKNRHLKKGEAGFDAKFTTLLIRDGGKELKMGSWHELEEANGKSIAVDGVHSLKGRPLLMALEDVPSDRLAYRIAWLEIRLAAAELIPKSGLAISGKLEHRDGLTWVTGSATTP